jgi:hypothetical protein
MGGPTDAANGSTNIASEKREAPPAVDPVSTESDVGLDHRRVTSSFGAHLARVYGQWQTWILYAVSGGLVAASFLLWYNFSSPPINSNLGFELFPWRQVALAVSPYNLYIWPGSSVPWTLGSPFIGFYGVALTASGGSYSAALFLSVVPLDIVGGLCLFYLLERWLARFKISSEYALFGVLIYAFDDYKLLNGFGTPNGYFSAGIWGPGDPAIIVILTFLTFLTLFRGLRYALLLGAFSFLAFSDFPNGTLVLAEEFLVVLGVLLAFWWVQDRGRAPGPRFVQVGVRGGLILGVIALANAYVFYPFGLVLNSYVSSLESLNPVYAFSYLFDAQETFTNTFRLITNWSIFTPEAPPWAVAYLTNPVAVLLSFLVPLLALSAVLFFRRLSDLLLYGLMLATLCISTSIYSPLATQFVWLTTNVAPFRAFYYGASLSPILLLFYCFFAPVTIPRLVQTLATLERGFTPYSATAGASLSLTRRSMGTVRHALANRRFWAVVLAVLLVVTVYPALTPQYSTSSSPGYPTDSSLPSYYSGAAKYLQSSDPNGAVMVFPEVEPFDSNAVNGSTWYSGIDLYPEIIPNPSVSSAYPDNYQGQFGDELPVPGLIYGMGSSICPISSCTRGGVGPIPSLGLLGRNASSDFISNNKSVINWTVGIPVDNRTFSGPGGQLTLTFVVNSSVPQTNGHWLLGYFPHSQDLGAYAYAMVTFRLTGVEPGNVYFGYHSFTPYGPADAYALGNYSVITQGSNATALIPLNDPTLPDGGNLTDVTNLFFADEAPPSSVPAVLTVQSIRLVPAVPALAPTWKSGNSEDGLNLSTSATGTILSYQVNPAVFEPNGHWALGYFPEPTNLTPYGYAVINYTTENVETQYLEFGYHSGVEFGPGNAFDLSDYLTLSSGTRSTTFVPLAAPTLEGGGNLSDITNLYFRYAPLSISTAPTFVNVTSISFQRGETSSGLLLANDLDRLGIEFAYVDTSVVTTNYPTFGGQYFNSVFGASPYFAEEFHAGSVTIYRNLRYSGVVVSPTSVEPVPTSSASLDGYLAPYADVYYNLTNEGVAYVGIGALTDLSPLLGAVVSGAVQQSPTEFTARVNSPGDALLELRTQFDPDWVATLSNGSVATDHVEVDGFANGWVIPRGSYTVTITFRGASTYAAVEEAGFLVPPVLLGTFSALWYRSRRRGRAEPSGGGPRG